MENISYTTSQMIITGIIATFGTAMITSKIYTQNITTDYLYFGSLYFDGKSSDSWPLYWNNF